MGNPGGEIVLDKNGNLYMLDIYGYFVGWLYNSSNGETDYGAQ